MPTRRAHRPSAHAVPAPSRHAAGPTVARVATTLAALLAALLAASTARAQDTPVGERPYAFTVEPFLSAASYDRGAGRSRATLGGYGVRVLFNRSDAADVARSLFRRATVGASATFTGTQNGVSTQHVMGELTASLFPRPIARQAIDPFVGLAAGVLRQKDAGGGSSSFGTVTPSAGVRVPLFSGLGLRGDLRAPVVFGSDTRLLFVGEGGVYLSF